MIYVLASHYFKSWGWNESIQILISNISPLSHYLVFLLFPFFLYLYLCWIIWRLEWVNVHEYVVINVNFWNLSCEHYFCVISPSGWKRDMMLSPPIRIIWLCIPCQISCRVDSGVVASTLSCNTCSQICYFVTRILFYEFDNIMYVNISWGLYRKQFCDILVVIAWLVVI